MQLRNVSSMAWIYKWNIHDFSQLQIAPVRDAGAFHITISGDSYHYWAYAWKLQNSLAKGVTLGYISITWTRARLAMQVS